MSEIESLEFRGKGIEMIAKNSYSFYTGWKNSSPYISYLWLIFLSRQVHKERSIYLLISLL